MKKLILIMFVCVMMFLCCDTNSSDSCECIPSSRNGQYSRSEGISMIGRSWLISEGTIYNADSEDPQPFFGRHSVDFNPVYSPQFEYIFSEDLCSFMDLEYGTGTIYERILDDRGNMIGLAWSFQQSFRTSFEGIYLRDFEESPLYRKKAVLAEDGMINQSKISLKHFGQVFSCQTKGLGSFGSRRRKSKTVNSHYIFPF